MSNFLINAQTAQTVGIQTGFGAYTGLAFFTARSIGPFVAQITISEQHTDILRITDHVVETGGVISDHAFMLPRSVKIIVGYSNSSLEATVNTAVNAVSGLIDAFSGG